MKRTAVVSLLRRQNTPSPVTQDINRLFSPRSASLATHPYRRSSTKMLQQKRRMTVLDVRCAVNTLHPKIVNLRLANVYDINFSKRMYMLKFAKGDNKSHVLVESGIRFHLTEWKRDKNALPSIFVMRLRKFLRTRFLSDFKQLGTDRVIDFIFGHGPSCTHLIIELYVSGNVVLADANFRIISILRPHANIETGLLAVGETYPVHLCYSCNTFIRDPVLLKAILVDETHRTEATNAIHRLVVERLTLVRSAAEENPETSSPNGIQKGDTKKKTMNVKNTISYLLPFASSNLITHAILLTQKTTAMDSDGAPISLSDTTRITEKTLSPSMIDWLLDIIIECIRKSSLFLFHFFEGFYVSKDDIMLKGINHRFMLM